MATNLPLAHSAAHGRSTVSAASSFTVVTFRSLIRLGVCVSGGLSETRLVPQGKRHVSFLGFWTYRKIVLRRVARPRRLGTWQVVHARNVERRSTTAGCTVKIADQAKSDPTSAGEIVRARQRTTWRSGINPCLWNPVHWSRCHQDIRVEHSECSSTRASASQWWTGEETYRYDWTQHRLIWYDSTIPEDFISQNQKCTILYSQVSGNDG